MTIRTLFYTLMFVSTLGASSGFAQEMEIIYYHNDALGSPRVATDESGNVLWRENYEPYGKKLENQEAEKGNHIGYTGKPHERITGFTYMNARYYDPVVGRFMAVDPVEFLDKGGQYFQRYTYADNNPYKYVDPTGLEISSEKTTEKDDTGGEKTHVEAEVTAMTIDQTKRKLSEEQLKGIAERIAAAIENTFSISEPGFTSHFTVDMVTGTPFSDPKDRHVFNIVDRESLFAGPGKTKFGTSHTIPSKTVDLNDVMTDPAYKGDAFGLSLENVSSHEFGHAGGLEHGEGLMKPGNMMKDTNVTRDQVEKIHDTANKK